MNVVGDFVIGLVSVLKTVGAPMLYRYPYRNSGEGLRSDWLSIGKDINSVMGQLKSDTDYERRN
jgi:hypothetical protein